jgi:hypothetical protein
VRIIQKLVWLIEADPSAEKMNALLKESEQIITNLAERLAAKSVKEHAFNALKANYESLAEKLPTLDSGGIDPKGWGELGKEERIGKFDDLASLRRALSGLDYPDIQAGLWTFTVLVALLIIAVGSYIRLHAPAAAPDRNATAQSALVFKELNNTLQIQTEIAKLRIQLDTRDEANATWEERSAAYEQLSKQLPADKLSYATLKHLGTLGGAVALRKQKLGEETLRSVEKGIAEDFKSPPSRYLWTDGILKWAEIAYWSLFGVLIGLMYYVSKRLKEGLFDRQDIATITAEVLMAPIVACVLFFLLDKTGLTEISASGDSIFAVLGFAFILGYAIRRTVGILDSVKTRLLPDP